MILVDIRSLDYQTQEHSSEDVLGYTIQLLVIIFACCVFSDLLSQGGYRCPQVRPATLCHTQYLCGDAMEQLCSLFV